MPRPSWLLPFFLLGPIAAARAQLLAASAPTRVARQARPSSSPVLVFNDIQDATVCGSTIISWFYSGPIGPLSLSITNDGIDQQPSNPTPSHTLADKVHRRAPGPTSTTIELASSIDPNDKAFLWSTINVPQGWYILNAEIPEDGFSQSSTRFFIRDPGNTSCSIASHNPPSTTSVTTTATSSSTLTSSSTTPAQSQTGAPPPSVSATSKVNVGAVVGGVIGGVGLAAIILALYIFFVCRPRRNQAPRSRAGSSPSSKKSLGFGSPGAGWGGLTSTDSHTMMGPNPVRPAAAQGRKPYSGTRHASRTESLSTVVDATAGPEPKYGSPSNEDIEAYLHGGRSRSASVVQQPWYNSSPSEEKIIGSVEELELEGVPNLAYTNNNGNNTNNVRPNHRSHSTSTFASELNMGQPVQRRPSATSPEPPVQSADTSLESTDASVTSPTIAPAPLPTGAQKKPARKPVPVYTPLPDSKPDVDTSFESAQQSPSSMAVTSAQGTLYSPALTSGFPPAPTAAAAGSGGHYSTRANRATGAPKEKEKRSKSKTRVLNASHSSSRESVLEPPPEREHGLVHKSSFGPGGVEGKPLHYLVPDILPQGGK